MRFPRPREEVQIMKSRIASQRRTFVLLILAVLLFGRPLVSVHGQTTGHLTMTITGQSLTAGFNNNVTIQVLNNYYSTIYDADLVVSLPTPLNLIGDDHWHYNSIALGKTVTISFQVYAPTSAIGSSYQGSLSAGYKQLGDVSSTEESHVVGFSVYGWINLLLYGISFTPTSVTPGGNATISGNLLNNLDSSCCGNTRCTTCSWLHKPSVSKSGISSRSITHAIRRAAASAWE